MEELYLEFDNSRTLVDDIYKPLAHTCGHRYDRRSLPCDDSAFRWLWNMTMPDIFSLKRITFGQAFRLPVLVALLLLVQLIFIVFATCPFPRVVG